MRAVKRVIPNYLSIYLSGRRCTLGQAALAIACISSAAPALPLFIATDNAALKVALAARAPASINATNLVARTAPQP